MPIDVTCAACESSFSLKDELAGRKVRCSKCQAVIEVPDADEDLPEFDTPGLHPAFHRDKFLLHQKHFSIHTKYSVCDEAEQEIMHVVRPSHYLRQLFAIFATLFVGFLLMAVSIGSMVALHKTIGEAATIVGCIVGFVGSAVIALAVAIWLSPKRHITFYLDETQKEKLLEILQDQKFTLRMATYTVLDDKGAVIGRYRKDYFANILRKRWDGFDANEQQFCVIREDSMILSLLRRFLGSFYGLLRTNFVIFECGPDRQDGQLLGEFNRKFTLRDRYLLDLSHDRGRSLDRRMAIALGVLLDTAEKR